MSFSTKFGLAVLAIIQSFSSAGHSQSTQDSVGKQSSSSEQATTYKLYAKLPGVFRSHAFSSDSSLLVAIPTDQFSTRGVDSIRAYSDMRKRSRTVHLYDVKNQKLKTVSPHSLNESRVLGVLPGDKNSVNLVIAGSNWGNYDLLGNSPGEKIYTREIDKAFNAEDEKPKNDGGIDWTAADGKGWKQQGFTYAGRAENGEVRNMRFFEQHQLMMVEYSSTDLYGRLDRRLGIYKIDESTSSWIVRLPENTQHDFFRSGFLANDGKYFCWVSSQGGQLNRIDVSRTAINRAVEPVKFKASLRNPTGFPHRSDLRFVGNCLKTDQMLTVDGSGKCILWSPKGKPLGKVSGLNFTPKSATFLPEVPAILLTDGYGGLHQISGPSGPTKLLANDSTIESVVPSQDGKYLAVRTKREIVLMKRTNAK